jgi:hypothetical protein
MGLGSSGEVAEYLGVDEQTLRRWRMEGRGPRYVKFGTERRARVRYRWEDVDAWCDEHEHAPQHETAPPSRRRRRAS